MATTLPNLGIRIRDFNADLVAERDTLRIRRFEMSSGDEASDALSLQGLVALTGVALLVYALSFRNGVAGTRLALYPREKLAEDISPDLRLSAGGFGGITLAHNTRTKDEVTTVLALAEKAGGRIVKPAQDVFWGGHSGYFSDPDGYYWEAAWVPMFTFDETGALVV